MSNLLKNELLCFVQNKFGNVPNQFIQSAVAIFYEEEKIVLAKKLIHEI